MFVLHLHDWELHLKDALGEYEKQEGQDNTIYVRGEIQVCRCMRMRLVPFDRRLRPVEVVYSDA